MLEGIEVKNSFKKIITSATKDEEPISASGIIKSPRL